MKRVVALGLLSLLAAAPAAHSSPPFKAALTASTHTPKVNAKWRYAVRVTDLRGKPVRASITVQIVDPFGGVHPVEFDCCKRNIVNHRINGVFRDAVEFPPESRGFKLTVRVRVRVSADFTTLTYWVRAR